MVKKQLVLAFFENEDAADAAVDQISNGTKQARKSS